MVSSACGRDEACVDRAAPHLGVFEQPKHERDVGANAENGKDRSADAARASAASRVSAHAISGHQWIVVDPDLVSFDYAGIHADAGSLRLAVEQQLSGLRQESLGGIFGV